MTKTPLLRLPRRLFAISLLAGILSLGVAAFADTDSMNCNSKLPASHVELAQGDQNTASHLQLSRPVAAGAQIELNVCNGDLTLAASKSGALQVTVDIGESSGQHMAGDYLEILDVNPHKIRVGLHLPRSAEARITVEIPVVVTDMQVNLARGSLSLAANQIGGQRMINVGYGHVRMEGNEDTYESLQVNVGMGSLNDHRKGGDSHHFIVAHSFSGTGKGSIEINVGMGHVDLDSSQGPI
jgi:hypothetical protein